MLLRLFRHFATKNGSVLLQLFRHFATKNGSVLLQVFRHFATKNGSVLLPLFSTFCKQKRLSGAFSFFDILQPKMAQWCFSCFGFSTFCKQKGSVLLIFCLLLLLLYCCCCSCCCSGLPSCSFLLRAALAAPLPRAAPSCSAATAEPGPD